MTIKKHYPFLCKFLSTCVIIITLSSSKTTDVPSQPGRPTVSKIKSSEYTIEYLAPLDNKGYEVTQYYIEYRDLCSMTWKFKGSSKTQQYHAKSARKNSVMQFRVVAESSAGISKPSYASNFITLRDPFE